MLQAVARQYELAVLCALPVWRTGHLSYLRGAAYRSFRKSGVLGLSDPPFYSKIAKQSIQLKSDKQPPSRHPYTMHMRETRTLPLRILWVPGEQSLLQFRPFPGTAL